MSKGKENRQLKEIDQLYKIDVLLGDGYLDSDVLFSLAVFLVENYKNNA